MLMLQPTPTPCHLWKAQLYHSSLSMHKVLARAYTGEKNATSLTLFIMALCYLQKREWSWRQKWDREGGACRLAFSSPILCHLISRVHRLSLAKLNITVVDCCRVIDIIFSLFSPYIVVYIESRQLSSMTTVDFPSLDWMAQIDISCVDKPENSNQSINRDCFETVFFPVSVLRVTVCLGLVCFCLGLVSRQNSMPGS